MEAYLDELDGDVWAIVCGDKLPELVVTEEEDYEHYRSEYTDAAFEALGASNNARKNRPDEDRSRGP